MYSKFIQIGDTFKAEQETFSTHRGNNYEVSHVFNDKGRFRIFVTDKYGKDVEIVSDSDFTPTAKTVTASDNRKLRARLDFYWANHDAPFVINKSWHYNFDTTEFFDFENKAYFCGTGMEGVIARISRYKKEHTETGWKIHPIEDTKKLIYNKQDFYDYFKDVDIRDFSLNAFHYDEQEAVDHLQYMLTIPHYDESLLNLPDTDRLVNVDRYVHSEKPELDAFLKICAEVIFDESELSTENKQIVYNVIEAYELLPKSFGPTGCAKLLMGKEKKQNKTVEHLSGTCTKLKQPQMFELCNIIESFMYVSKIFVRTDDYSNGDEWRGAYEFIGSKAINTAELTKIKNELK